MVNQLRLLTYMLSKLIINFLQKFIRLVAFATSLMLLHPAAFADEVPRVQMNTHGQYIYVGSVPALKIASKSIVPSYYIQNVSCEIGHQEASLLLSELLDPNNSVVFAMLKNFFAGNYKNNFSDLIITVDNLKADVHSRPAFFIPDIHEKSMIVLDCSKKSYQSWKALLAHELVHYMNKGRKFSPWMDEMLAQVIESEASYGLPYQRINSLKNSKLVPSIAGDASPHSHQEYGVNLLFGRYLYNLFGASLFKQLGSGVANFSELALKISQFIEPRQEFHWLKKLGSERNLMNHFHLALNINRNILNGGKVFRVPGWSGFSESIKPLSAGQALELIAKMNRGESFGLSLEEFRNLLEVSSLENLSVLNLAIFQILKNDDEFSLQKIEDLHFGSVPAKFKQSHFLLIKQ